MGYPWQRQRPPSATGAYARPPSPSTALQARAQRCYLYYYPLLLPARGERPEARAELTDGEAARDTELGQSRVVPLTLEQHRACRSW